MGRQRIPVRWQPWLYAPVDLLFKKAEEVKMISAALCDIEPDEDPRQVIKKNSIALAKAAKTDISEHTTKVEFMGTSPHQEEYDHYNRSWVFDGEPLPACVDESKTPFEIVRDCLGPVKRLLWTLFYVYVLPDMEEAFIRHQQIAQEEKYTPMLLGTMIIKMKDEKTQFWYVRFIERLGKTEGFRKIEIVENKLVTRGSKTQYDYICSQITSMAWYVAYAQPWEQSLISTEEMISGMTKQSGFARSNTATESC